MDDLREWLAIEEDQLRPQGRPLVILSYAQSLDGSLTHTRGRPAAISGPDTRRMTHQLRVLNDAILVGIGTVLSDDPQLTVRLAEGNDPRPVILDSRLRIPLGCRLLKREYNLPWLAALAPADPARRELVQQTGAQVLEIPAGEDGRVHLPGLLEKLAEMGVRRLMVEGGAAVITAFLAARLADLAVVTIAPFFLGGQAATVAPLVRTRAGQIHAPRLVHTALDQIGRDWVVRGRIQDGEL